MATRKRTPAKPQSVAEQARAIYNRHVQLVEDGRHDTSMSFRQAVLEEYRSTFDTSENTLASYYTNSQKAAKTKVNSLFEIERELPLRSSSTKNAKAVTPGPAKVLKKPRSNTVELTLVPKQGPGAPAVTPASKAPPAKAATPISPSVSAPSAKLTPKQRAVKVHADLIALCKEEIAEAFGSLEELIDNVDQLGDAKALRTFTRQVRSACKIIENQLATKTMLDKQQANRILPKL